MTQSAKTTAVLGFDGKAPTIVWRCPECGTWYDHCYYPTIPSPYPVSCDMVEKHASFEPLPIEVTLSTMHVGGVFTVNGREIRIATADCLLFGGQLDVNFGYDTTLNGFSRIPFGDATEFSELSGRTIAMADWAIVCDDGSLLKPGLSFDYECYWISSLSVDEVIWSCEPNVVSLHLIFKVLATESDAEISGEGRLTALCHNVDRIEVLGRPIPIRFAKTYLPLLDLPSFPVGTTRADVVARLGPPHKEGGGAGSIYPHPWIHYTFRDYRLRFQLDGDLIQEIMVDRSGGPWIPPAPASL